MDINVEKETSGIVIRYTVAAEPIPIYHVTKYKWVSATPPSLSGYGFDETIGYTPDFEKAMSVVGAKVVARRGYRLPNGVILLGDVLQTAEPIL